MSLTMALASASVVERDESTYSEKAAVVEKAMVGMACARGCGRTAVRARVHAYACAHAPLAWPRAASRSPLSYFRRGTGCMHASRTTDRPGADRSDDPAPTDTPAQLTYARVLVEGTIGESVVDAAPSADADGAAGALTASGNARLPRRSAAGGCAARAGRSRIRRVRPGVARAEPHPGPRPEDEGGGDAKSSARGGARRGTRDGAAAAVEGSVRTRSMPRHSDEEGAVVRVVSRPHRI